MEIVRRKEWGARPPKKRNTIPTPTRELWCHHTAGNHRGASGMRQIQDFHMDGRGWNDIAYSWVIDPVDLVLYEGRGPGVAGGHTEDHNTISHAYCVMGNFETLRPTDALIRFMAEAMRHGHAQGWHPNQFTGGHRDVGSTACPGRHLYAAIPEINRLALDPGGSDVDAALVNRIEDAAASLGYTVKRDGQLDQREAEAVENMVEGIRKLLADKQRLLTDVETARSELGEAQQKLTEVERFNAELSVGVRQLAANAADLADKTVTE